MTKRFDGAGPARRIEKEERAERKRLKRERKRRAKEEKPEPVRFGEPMREEA